MASVCCVTSLAVHLQMALEDDKPLWIFGYHLYESSVTLKRHQHMQAHLRPEAQLLMACRVTLGITWLIWKTYNIADLKHLISSFYPGGSPLNSVTDSRFCRALLKYFEISKHLR